MRDKSIRAFLLAGLLLAAPAVVCVWRMDRFALHLAMNGFHDPFLDSLFPVVTEFANGWVPTALALLMLAISWRAFLMVGLSTGLGAVVVQFLKQVVFSGHDRPSMFLDHMPGLPLVAGLDLHHHFSFPSGHSTAAFSMCLALAVVIGRQVPAVALALAAGLMAYSRVYLSQHFTEDILAGASIGCASGTVVYMLLYRGRWRLNQALDRSPWRRQNQ
ncbi:MAG: phosphatase PAP2 family protein [Flavobacteriales bacterium]|nr:phosphatase PAP2 family protein [Flavobacteriales bacterium]MBP9080499.1 phosphatase PAP2 family protein [Flavobacteriales bacterium]